MDFMEIVRKRFSVRKNTEEPVTDEQLALILEAGRLAPLAILVCADHDDVWKRRFDGKTLTDIDTRIVTTHMMLEATELGLGTLWVCAFDPDVVRREFDLSAHLEPINLLAVGHTHEKAADVRPRTTRKPMEETVWYERYQERAAE
jgi:nitroreductase